MLLRCRSKLQTLFLARHDRTPSHWDLLGRSPLETDRVPAGNYRIRTMMEGSGTVERLFEISPGGWNTIEVQLHAQGAVPPGMVWVPGTGPQGLEKTMFPALAIAVPGFWPDRHEVTSRQLKELVDAGGYQQKQLEAARPPMPGNA